MAQKNPPHRAESVADALVGDRPLAPGLRAPRRWLVLAGPLLAILGTIYAFRQPPRPDPLDIPQFPSLRWWLLPHERNAFARLPVLPDDARSVFASPGAPDVWAVGDGGLLLHSADGGATWTHQNLKARQLVQSKARQAATAAPGKAPGSVVRYASYIAGPTAVPGGQGLQGAPCDSALANRLAEQRDPKYSPSVGVAVPDLLGRTQVEAAKMLVGAGLCIGKVQTLRGQGGLSVTSQSPAAGSRVPPATSVDLVLEPASAGANQTADQEQVGDTTMAQDTIERGDSMRRSRERAAPPTLGATEYYPSLNDVCFATPTDGWLVGDNGVLFRTRDGGLTWEQAAVERAESFNAVACAAPARAVVVGPPNAALQTDDGTTWLASALPFAGELVDARFVDSLTILLVGEPFSIPGPVLVRSEDGGKTWQSGQLGASRSLGIRSLSFADGRHGFAGADQGVWITDDGGRTWQPAGCRTGRDRTARGPAGASIEALSATEAIAADEDGVVWRTRDGWQTCDSTAALDTYVMDLMHGQNGGLIATAVGRGLLVSSDGGRRWRVAVGGQLWTALSFHDSTTGWVAGLEGLMARTGDGGARWTPSRLPTTSPLWNVIFRTERHGFAISGGSVYETLDGGGTWRLKPGPAGQRPIFPTAFFDTLNGWGGSEDTVYATRDGGRTWARASGLALTALADSTKGDLASASFRYDPVARDTIGWVLTDRGLWAYQGRQWTRDTLARGLLAISRVTPALGFALDSTGGLLRTGDGGRSWSAVVIEPRKYPAPWYYLFLPLCVLLTSAAAASRGPIEEERRKSVADLLVSDRPLREGDRDVLDFKSIAGGLSRFLQNRQTQPPLTIAVVGKWGTGKSSLMLLLQRDLDRHLFRTVWFNAWHHQREESLLASLLEGIRQRATPPVWTGKGMRFRRRLLWSRYRRYRAPLRVFLVVLVCVFGWVLKNPGQRLTDLRSIFWSLVNLLGGAAPQTPGAEAPKGTVVALLVSVAGAIWTYLKGLKAFGVSPALLAKSVASASKMRTVELQTGFRYRFAQDFREVTDALKPARLVIFIDDLDRCKPEQVLEILEAVNFLVESGDCVVVMGIDRERVIGCVGVGFKDVAAMLVESEIGEPPADESAIPSGPPPLRLARDDDGAALKGGTAQASEDGDERPTEPKRSPEQIQAEYARRYLEKLINMEIAIPTADAEDLGSVMTASMEEEAAKTKEPVPLSARILAYWGPLQTIAVTAALIAAFFVGFRGTQWLPWSTAPTPVVVPIAEPPGTTATAPSSGSTPEGVTPQRDRGLPTDTTGLRRTPLELIPGAPEGRSWVPLAGGLVAALLFMLWLLLPSEPSVVGDSPAFSQALKSWSPVLYASLTTPRSAKKFLNRVRYLAMLQRETLPARAPIERALSWVAERSDMLYALLRRFGVEREDEAPAVPDKIPENVLVALSVVRETRPTWLTTPEFWDQPLGRFVASVDGSLPESLRTALEKVGHLPPLKRYREDWVKISTGVRTG